MIKKCIYCLPYNLFCVILVFYGNFWLCACVCVRVDFVVLLHILILYKQNAFLNLFV